jgi:hypothetical protein
MNSFSPVVGLILFTLTANSQQLIVEERKVKNEESIELSSWTARLDQDMDYCMETYGSFIKEFFKIKVTKQGKTMLVAEKVAIPELSNLRLDQRALFATETSGTAVSFTFSPGYDIHFGHDAYEEEFKKGELFVKNFVRYHYNEFYGEKVKSTESQIKSKLNDIESNIKKTERNKKTIADSGDDAKSLSKNEKLLRENDNYTSDSNTKRNEISILEADLKVFNECLRKVETFR